MNTLRLTLIKRILLKKMLSNLFFEYKDITIQRDGTVRFREKWWKVWTTEKTSAFELCIINIPQRIQEIYKKNTSSDDVIINIAKIIASDPEIDIIYYLWDIFKRISFPLPGIAVVSDHIRIWKEHNLVEEGRSISMQDIMSKSGNPTDVLNIPPQRASLGGIASLLKKVSYWHIKQPAIKWEDPFKNMIFPVPRVALVQVM